MFSTKYPSIRIIVSCDSIGLIINSAKVSSINERFHNLQIVLQSFQLWFDIKIKDTRGNRESAASIGNIDNSTDSSFHWSAT